MEIDLKLSNLDNSNNFFRIASYNILAESLIHRSLNVTKYNIKHQDRLNSIFDNLSNINPDVICIQEAENSNYFINKITENKKFDYKINIRPNNSDGCCIIWNKNKFIIIDYYYIEFKLETEATSLYNKNNIAQFVILQNKSIKDIYFIIVNTHLLYNNKRGDIKLAQVDQIMKSVDIIKLKILKQIKNCTFFTFLCGDFNSTPSSGVYKLITNSSLNVINLPKDIISGQLHMNLDNKNNHKFDFTNHKKKNNQAFNEKNYLDSTLTNNWYYEIISTFPSFIKNSNKLVLVISPFMTIKNNKKQKIYNSEKYHSSYFIVNNEEPSLTYYSQHKIGTIDYIFYSIERENYNIRPTSTLILPEYDNTLCERIKNNDIYPSDHFPLAVDFLITKNNKNI